jgi:hypothetical protein
MSAVPISVTPARTIFFLSSSSGLQNQLEADEVDEEYTYEATSPKNFSVIPTVILGTSVIAL